MYDIGNILIVGCLCFQVLQIPCDMSVRGNTQARVSLVTRIGLNFVEPNFSLQPTLC